MLAEVGRRDASASLLQRAGRHACARACACDPSPLAIPPNLTYLTSGSHHFLPVTCILGHGSVVLYGYQQAQIQA